MASDHLELVACINEENKRRKRRRIILTEMYFESCVLAMAYIDRDVLLHLFIWSS
jgi:hypothetical protein